jgi:hypothetical protein
MEVEFSLTTSFAKSEIRIPKSEILVTLAAVVSHHLRSHIREEYDEYS